MKYSIVIPTYNHCDDLLKPCIDSIIKYTDLTDTEIIVVANGCTDNTHDYVMSLGDEFKLIWFDDAIGFTKAANQGILHSTGEYVILLNNDTEILLSNKNYWIDELNRPFINDEMMALTGPLKLRDEDINSDFIVFWCAMIRRAIFDKIGVLDEIFNPGYGEDIDFSQRVIKSGFKFKCISDSEYKNGTNVGSFPLWHKNNMTFGEIQEYGSVIVQRNRQILKERYYQRGTIAVITPAYNCLEHVDSFIKSVKSQVNVVAKHYIFDDASTDDTLKHLLSYPKDDSIVIKYNPVNLGQSHARNTLIKQAISDGCQYIAFLDADDKWEPTHLIDSMNALERMDIVYSTPQFILENGDDATPINIPQPREFIGKQLSHNNFIWISSVVARSNCFNDAEFDGNLNGIEDWDMWYRLNQQGFKFIKKSQTTMSYLVKQSGQAASGISKHELFKEKHNTMQSLKLNLASGDDYMLDCINIDLYPTTGSVDVICDIKTLPYEDNSVDEIVALHIIEHLDFYEGQVALKEWYRVLKPGGKLCLETPDFLETCSTFVKSNEDTRVALYSNLFAHPWIPGGTHKFLFTETQLASQLAWCGFKNIKRITPVSKYSEPKNYNLLLTMETYK